jgi:methylglutaconyl-CoA hydratase
VTSTANDQVLRIETAGGVARLTLDSPTNRNALSRAMRAQLRAGLAAALADDAVRVVVLDHTGRVFCSGMDLTEATGGSAGDQGVNELPELLATIWSAPKPVLAVVRGPARAGGVGLAAACDVVVAGAAATFAFTEVRIGVIPAVISVTVLPRLVPRAAHELFLTGETFDADRAAAIGLINSSVPADELDAEVARYTGMLALGGPIALAATKEMLRQPKPTDLPTAFAEMLTQSAAFFASEEGQEGIRAFAQKRPPSWVPQAD